MKWIVTLTGVMLCFSLNSCSSKHSPGGFYSGIQIGPGETLLPKGQRFSSEPLDLSYVRYIRGGFITMADHMLRTSSSNPPHVALFLTGNLENDKLDETLKRTELLHADLAAFPCRKPASTIDPSHQTMTPWESFGTTKKRNLRSWFLIPLR